MKAAWILPLCLALSGAGAASAQPAAPAAEEPICTTITKVVKRGDVVLSTSSETKCGKAGDGGGGFDVELPDAAGIFASLISSTPNLQAKEARGDWRVVERGSRKVCRMTLMSAAGSVGRKVRTLDCAGPQASAAGWKLEDNTVGLYRADGGLIVRLRGDRDRLAGRPDGGGEEIVLQR